MNKMTICDLMELIASLFKTGIVLLVLDRKGNGHFRCHCLTLNKYLWNEEMNDRMSETFQN